MLQVHSADLQQQCVDLFRQISSSTQSAVEIAQVAKAWSTLEQAITASAREGSLDAQTASAISTLVFNVKIVATSRATLEEESKLELTNLADELHSINLVVSDDTRSKRRSNRDDFDNYPTSKRNCRPITTKHLPTPSPPPPSTTSKSLKSTPTLIPTPAQDPVRLFFLNHLSNPYPTPSEKEKLCKKAKITRRKLESDLTNWRRRSDWTDIMNTYCGGDKGAMRTMVAAIERGEERDGELLERFGRMRAYLEKRDEQAGEWVHKLAEMVQTGRLDEMRFRHIDDDNENSEHEFNSGSESEDDGQGQNQQEDEDAEGESEDGYRYQTANLPTSTLRSNIKPGQQVDSPYTTVPLNMTSLPIKVTPGSQSPLTDLSPASSIGSHISAIPYTQHIHPPAQYITYEHQPSTKSSYSSLSAASAAAGPRKRNISDSSTSTSSNLRSTSGSSTSSYHQPGEKDLKRPAKTSFSRSSRSRVEDILSDHSTPSTWIAGHAPNAGFHIGADPRFIPQHPYQTPQQRDDAQAPPPYEMGPYLMAPDAWNHNMGYGWTSTNTPTPTPTPTSGGTGGFTIPTEYEFTFGIGHGYGEQGHGGAVAQR